MPGFIRASKLQRNRFHTASPGQLHHVFGAARPVAALPVPQYDRALTFVDQDRLIAAVVEGNEIVFFLQAGSGEKVMSLDLGEPARSLADSLGTTLIAAGGENGNLRIWDAGHGFALKASVSLTSAINCLGLSPKGHGLLAGRDEHEVTLISGSYHAALAMERQVTHHDTVTSVTFSPDGERAATAGLDERVQVWQPPAADTPLVINTGTWTWGVRWSTDGKTIVTVDERHGMREWSSASGARLASRPPSGSKSRNIAAGELGTVEASAASGEVWAVGDGEEETARG